PPQEELILDVIPGFQDEEPPAATARESLRPRFVPRPPSPGILGAFLWCLAFLALQFVIAVAVGIVVAIVWAITSGAATRTENPFDPKSLKESPELAKITQAAML